MDTDMMHSSCRNWYGGKLNANPTHDSITSMSNDNADNEKMKHSCKTNNTTRTMTIDRRMKASMKLHGT